MSDTGKKLVEMLRAVGEEETAGFVQSIDGLTDAMARQGELNTQVMAAFAKMAAAIEAMGKENTLLWKRVTDLEQRVAR